MGRPPTLEELGRVRRCYRCGEPQPPERAHGYCRRCFNAYSRERRVLPEQRRKNLARYQSKKAHRAGVLTSRPCQRCGDPDIEMHHRDYDQPLQIDWLCRSCHLQEHDQIRWHARRASLSANSPEPSR